MALINELIGNFGRYHYWLCFIVFASKFGVAFHQMAIIFLAPPARYYCPGSNATCCDNPVYDKSIFTRTIVTEWNLICEDAWLKDFSQTIFQFGVLSGSLSFGIASDKYGRKPTLIISVIIEIFAGIMTSLMPDYWSFTLVRMLVGYANGGIMIISFVIVMEYVGSVNRDLISALFHIPFTAGHIVLAAVGYLIRDYYYFQLFISISNVFLLFYICFLPETPRWLLVMNKTEQAIGLMERVAKINKLPTDMIRQRVELYQLKHKRTRPRSTVLDLFRTPNLRTNITVMSFAWLVCSYCFYGVTYYISHLTGDVFINVVATGSVCMCACIICIPLIKFSKRKTVVVAGNTLCSLCLFIVGSVPEGKASVVIGCIGELLCYVIFVVVYLYCTEMFPTVVRNAAIGICSMMARLGAMIAPFAAGLRPYGKWCAPVAFGIFPMIAGLLCLLLPETKDCELMSTIEEAEALGKKSSRNPRTTNDVNITEREVASWARQCKPAGRGTMAVGFLLCTAWYYTILAGFFILYCPVMYLMFFSHRLYRKLVDTLFSLWELYPVALFQCCCNTQLHHFGDYVNPDEKTIIVMNHRTRVDWNYVWIALYHATQNPSGELCSCKQIVKNPSETNSALDLGGKSKIKFVLKDEIKNIPGMGWIMQLNFFLYVKRNWREDQVNLSQFVDYYQKLNYDYRLVLFPEGTDLSEENLRRSEKFAHANNMQHYEYVLHPRTTGWVALCSRLRESGLASVYDVTVAYDNPAQTEMDLFRGRIPMHVSFYFKRYPIEKIPQEDEELKNWLGDRWREKEYSLRRFHNDGNFIDPQYNRAPPHRSPRSLSAAKLGLLFWTVIDIIFLYSIINSVMFQFWVLYHCFLFIFITWYFGGFHNIQYKLLRKLIM